MEKKSSNYEICIGFLFGKEKQNKKWSVSCKKSYVRQKKKNATVWTMQKLCEQKYTDIHSFIHAKITHTHTHTYTCKKISPKISYLLKVFKKKKATQFFFLHLRFFFFAIYYQRKSANSFQPCKSKKKKRIVIIHQNTIPFFFLDKQS